MRNLEYWLKDNTKRREELDKLHGKLGEDIAMAIKHDHRHTGTEDGHKMSLNMLALTMINLYEKYDRAKFPISVTVEEEFEHHVSGIVDGKEAKKNILYSFLLEEYLTESKLDLISKEYFSGRKLSIIPDKQYKKSIKEMLLGTDEFKDEIRYSTMIIKLH